MTPEAKAAKAALGIATPALQDEEWERIAAALRREIVRLHHEAERRRATPADELGMAAAQVVDALAMIATAVEIAQGYHLPFAEFTALVNAAWQREEARRGPRLGWHWRG